MARGGKGNGRGWKYGFNNKGTKFHGKGGHNNYGNNGGNGNNNNNHNNTARPPGTSRVRFAEIADSLSSSSSGSSHHSTHEMPQAANPFFPQAHAPPQAQTPTQGVTNNYYVNCYNTENGTVNRYYQSPTPPNAENENEDHDGDVPMRDEDEIEVLRRTVEAQTSDMTAFAEDVKKFLLTIGESEQRGESRPIVEWHHEFRRRYPASQLSTLFSTPERPVQPPAPHSPPLYRQAEY